MSKELYKIHEKFKKHYWEDFASYRHGFCKIYKCACGQIGWEFKGPVYRATVGPDFSEIIGKLRRIH